MRKTVALSVGLALGLGAMGQNWEEVPLIQHQHFQAVNPDGSTAYTDGFPTRLFGVVLNNPEDWLDPTPAYDPEYHPFQMGGQWEIFVQAFPLPGLRDGDDFGGTAAWMGQNYGNLPWLGDPVYSYTNEEWVAELARLNYPEGPGTPPLRAGDLIELRARGGLPYQGKMNVNEQHSNSPTLDFEIVILERGVGFVPPEAVTLSDLLAEVGGGQFEFIWDPTRQTGGERYQAARIALRGVKLADPGGWGTNADLTLVDATGRTLPVHLGRNPAFDSRPAPGGTFNLLAILNQESWTGQGGYYALVMHPDDFVCGDANCDAQLDFADINPFVLALTSPAAYAAAYPECTPDLTGDFAVDFADINVFVAALTTGGCP